MVQVKRLREVMKSFRTFGWMLTWLTAAGLVLVGCTSAPTPLSAEQCEAIYWRAEAQFAKAILLKPRETAPTNTPAFQLAPLLLVEVPNTNDVPSPPPIQTVFSSEGKVRLCGKAHDQVTYIWRRDETSHQSGRQPAWQGIRITLNASGRPVIWEVLADSSGAELVIVSRNFEAAVQQEFGAALAGRPFAAERAVGEAPKVIVARVIDDGPVPMGPIVHLRAATGDVSTLICRCMTTQARELIGQGQYILLSQDASGITPGKDLWLDPEPAGAALARKLRLPAGF
jgi:hypothetical protein